jgi:hypothetical protein
MPKQATDRLGAYESAEEQHLGHLEPTVSRHATQFDAGVQQHLGVLRPRVGASAAVLTPGVSLVGGDISTPAGLRQAVILSELLAPPLALRPPDQHS